MKLFKSFIFFVLCLSLFGCDNTSPSPVTNEKNKNSSASDNDLSSSSTISGSLNKKLIGTWKKQSDTHIWVFKEDLTFNYLGFYDSTFMGSKLYLAQKGIWSATDSVLTITNQDLLSNSTKGTLITDPEDIQISFSDTTLVFLYSTGNRLTFSAVPEGTLPVDDFWDVLDENFFK